MSKIKRYEHGVELVRSSKDDSDLNIVASSNMIEKSDGEYISVYDMPDWIRMWLGISDT